MIDLRPPATGTEAYLAAILEELRVIRVALGGGGQAVPAAEPTPTAEAPTSAPVESSVRRTRTRTRGAGT